VAWVLLRFFPPLTAMITPTSSGGTVRELAQSAFAAMLPLSCLGMAAASRDGALATLSLSAAALSSITAYGVVAWLSRREAHRTFLVSRSRMSANAPSALEPAAAVPTPGRFDRIAHDLDDLMTVVVVQADLLRQRRGGETHQLETMVDAARRSAGLARELVAFARQKCGRDPQPAMKVDAFAPSIRKSEPPRAGSEPPKGPGLVKAPSPALPSEPPQASIPPGSAGHDSVPLQSGRRVRLDHLSASRGVILLVDDEELLLKTTRRMLEQRGFRVVTAADGAAAIALAMRTPDLRVLLTDLSLPGMDGRELARRLRWTLPELRVLFMSGFDAETSGLDGREGADGFLSKPFTARELEDRVSELFAGYDSDAAARQG
jgi:CheY-like chemotaxis protein